jgi:hemerythrin-like domain-containing protein
MADVTYKKITDLKTQHDYLNHLFLGHQKKLMRSDFDGAYETLLKYNHVLHQHMIQEEKVLLPLYKENISLIPSGGAYEFFIHEHHRITRYMEQFIGTTEDNKNTIKKGQMDLVLLFDMYYDFKHLLEHHHTREDTFLFRLLERVLSDEIKKDVLNHFAAIAEQFDGK